MGRNFNRFFTTCFKRVKHAAVEPVGKHKQQLHEVKKITNVLHHQARHDQQPTYTMQAAKAIGLLETIYNCIE